ncbi:MAG: hypothetical protein ACNYPG_01225 [Candidatus Porifericomitaceae bacterium WSBS_2022_MAG_OTU9]
MNKPSYATPPQAVRIRGGDGWQRLCAEYGLGSGQFGIVPVGQYRGFA